MDERKKKVRPWMAVLVFPDFGSLRPACTPSRQRSWTIAWKLDHGRSHEKLVEWWLEAGVPLAMDRIG